jgi:hypothetical protein
LEDLVVESFIVDTVAFLAYLADQLPKVLILEEGSIIDLTNLNIRVWRISNRLTISELHDRMILTSFIDNKASVILTNDSEIAEFAPIIWD